MGPGSLLRFGPVRSRGTAPGTGVGRVGMGETRFRGVAVAGGQPFSTKTDRVAQSISHSPDGQTVQDDKCLQNGKKMHVRGLFNLVGTLQPRVILPQSPKVHNRAGTVVSGQPQRICTCSDFCLLTIQGCDRKADCTPEPSRGSKDIVLSSGSRSRALTALPAMGILLAVL